MSRSWSYTLYDKLDVADVISKTKAEIERAKVEAAIAEKILTVLKTFDGKFFSKRVETAIKKELAEGYVVYLDLDNTCYVNVWGNDISYNHKLNVFVGYRLRSESFNYDSFMENHSHAFKNVAENVGKYEEALKNAEASVAEYNAAYERFMKARDGLSYLVLD